MSRRRALALLCFLWTVAAVPRATAGDPIALEPLTGGRDWNEHTPDFHADGTKILFSSYRAGPKTQLFTVDLVDGRIEQLTSGDSASFYGSYSPDGSRIAFVSDRGGELELWTMNADGSGATPLTEGGHGVGERPSWSPDGRRLAFDWGRTGNQDVWILDLDSRETTRVTDHPADDGYPSWSPDGERLVFHSRRGTSMDLYVVRTDGSGLRRLTAEPTLEWAPAWSPDGEEIAYWSGAGFDFNLFVIRPDGGGRRQLTDARDWNWSPRWSRDGEWLTFSSRRTGRRGIYVIRRDGSAERQLTNRKRSDFLETALTAGIDEALSRLAYSRRAEPERTYTTQAEIRSLTRELLDRGAHRDALRLAEADLIMSPLSSDAGDLWIAVRRAMGRPAPPTAHEIVHLYRSADEEGAWRLYRSARRDYPAWRPLSSGWFGVLLRELEGLGRWRALERLAAEAAAFFPERPDFEALRARALHELERGG